MILLFQSLEEAQQKIPLNKTLRVVVNNKALCIVRTAQGFKAIADECPHLGQSLSQGKINYLNEIVCPWHSYRFSLRNGQETTSKHCKNLKFYEIVVKDNEMFVNI